MITEISIQGIRPVVASVNASQKVLNAVPGSPLESLMRWSRKMVEGSIPSEQSEQEQVLVDVSMVQAADGSDGHSVMVDEYVELLAKSLRAHLSYAREQVLPAVARIHSAIKSKIESDGPVPYAVEQVWMGDAVANPYTEQLVANYYGYSNKAKTFTVFPERTEEQVMELLETGSAQFDTVLSEMIANHPEGWVSGIYDAYFRLGKASKMRYSEVGTGAKPDYVFDTGIANMDEYLVVVLLATKLIQNAPEKTGMSLPEYKAAMTSLKAAACAGLAGSIRKYQQACERNRLVLAYPTAVGESVIYVCGPVYREFLGKGGEAEVVIGSAVSEASDRAIVMNDFVTSAAKYKARFMRWMDRQEAERNERIASTIRSTAARVIDEEIAKISPELNTQARDVSDMRKEIGPAIKSISDAAWRAGLYTCVRQVFCSIVCPSSNALEILRNIDDVCAKNPDMDPREAGYHVIKKILVQHLVSQVSCTEVSSSVPQPQVA